MACNYRAYAHNHGNLSRRQKLHLNYNINTKKRHDNLGSKSLGSSRSIAQINGGDSLGLQVDVESNFTKIRPDSVHRMTINQSTHAIFEVLPLKSCLNRKEMWPKCTIPDRGDLVHTQEDEKPACDLSDSLLVYLTFVTYCQCTNFLDLIHGTSQNSFFSRSQRWP